MPDTVYLCDREVADSDIEFGGEASPSRGLATVRIGAVSLTLTRAELEALLDTLEELEEALDV